MIIYSGKTFSRPCFAVRGLICNCCYSGQYDNIYSVTIRPDLGMLYLLLAKATHVVDAYGVGQNIVVSICCNMTNEDGKKLCAYSCLWSYCLSSITFLRKQ